MEVYEKSTAPLTEFYRRLGLLVPVTAQSTAEATLERTMVALQSREQEASQSDKGAPSLVRGPA
jgi:hypothetical protein